MAITVSVAAANHINKFLAKRGKGLGLRLGVRTTGCSGLAYKLEYVDAVQSEDHVFDSYIDGTELDFAKEGLNEGFKFKNPNVKDECGCGESFTI
jgi:iron-sulfur cluster assembly protein